MTKDHQTPASQAEGVREVIQLCEALESDHPLSRTQLSELQARYRSATGVNWSADDKTQQEQIDRVSRFQSLMTNSTLNRDLEAAFDTQRADDLAVHARNIRNHYEARKISGGLIPPHSALRIAVILRKAKRPDLERRFLEAWCRHEETVPGMGRSKASLRLQKLREKP